MQKLTMPALWLTCALALSGCGKSSAVRPPPICPEPQPPPPEVMKAPTYGQQMRSIWLQPDPSP